MFAFAFPAELLRGDNPVSKVPRRVIPENEIRFIVPENVATLIAAVPTRRRNLFAAAVYLGARKGEFLALRVRSVDLQRRCVTLARSHDGATKSGKVQVVAIPDERVPFREDALARTKSEFLFPGPNGKRRSPYVRLEVVLRRAQVKAKVIDSWRHVCRRPGCGEVVEARMRPRGAAPSAISRCGRCPCPRT